MPIDATPLALSTLPVIVAGPVLRRLTRTEVSVWVALTEPDPISLRVNLHGIESPDTSNITVVPTKVGQNLWMAVLTAGAPNGEFVAGALYEYQLNADWESNPDRSIDWDELSLPSSSLPTFLAPPENVEDLVLYHASCRKPHGGGRDGLALAEVDLNNRFMSSAAPQPHLLILSGDQIYADEVGHPLMARVLRVAQDLVGLDESDVFGPPPPIGGRGPGTRALGYTGATANHLWSYSEFIAMYLLVWSPVLWPVPLENFPAETDPEISGVDSNLKQESWDKDRDNLQLFFEGLASVRRVLANIPSLMIFDDHDVTDDWNLDLPWVKSVYDRSAGRRAVTNALMAYALCQHWGNNPLAFSTRGTPEQVLLESIQSSTQTLTSPAIICQPLLGVPPTGLPSAPPAQVLRDLSDNGAIRFDLDIGPEQGWPMQLFLLDERTAREYPTETGRGARISRAALALQLPTAINPSALTIVVAPAPILGSTLIEHVIQPLANVLKEDGARFADFESWSTITANHQDLLLRLSSYHPVVVLSGDVHYGFTAKLTREQDGVRTCVAQLTGSATKNVEIKNASISMFSELIMRLGIERLRGTSGYHALTDEDKTKLLSAPEPGSVLPWDETSDVVLGRLAREGLSTPAAIPTSIARAYNLSEPAWTYEVEPIDDPMSDFDAPQVEAVWEGWIPQNSLAMTDALQSADHERFARMFVGLPQFATVSFNKSGDNWSVRHVLRCPVGNAESSDQIHLTQTNVQLS